MIRRPLRPSLLLGLAVVVLVSGCADSEPVSTGDLPGIPPAAQQATVDRVIDGDTIWVRVDEAGGRLPPAAHKVRLLEIDAPEVAGSPAGPECGGEEASGFAQRHLAAGTRVFLLHDREDQDRYGRYLRYVWTSEGMFFNHEAVRTGHVAAVLFEPNDAYIDLLRAAEDEARAAGRGIWGEYCRAGGS